MRPNQSLLQCECEHVTEHGQSSVNRCLRDRLTRPWVHRFRTFLLEIRRMSAGKLSEPEISDNVFNSVQPFFLEIGSRVANFAIVLKIDVREFPDRIVLRLFLARQL